MRGFARHQLAQHILQDSAVGVVLGFLRSVDAYESFEFLGLAVRGGSNSEFPAGSKFFDQLGDPRDLENLEASQSERFCGFSRPELQRENPHAHQVRAVNALVAFGDSGAHAE